MTGLRTVRPECSVRFGMSCGSSCLSCGGDRVRRAHYPVQLHHSSARAGAAARPRHRSRPAQRPQAIHRRARPGRGGRRVTARDHRDYLADLLAYAEETVAASIEVCFPEIPVWVACLRSSPASAGGEPSAGRCPAGVTRQEASDRMRAGNHPRSCRWPSCQYCQARPRSADRRD